MADLQKSGDGAAMVGEGGILGGFSIRCDFIPLGHAGQHGYSCVLWAYYSCSVWAYMHVLHYGSVASTAPSTTLEAKEVYDMVGVRSSIII